ncbi:MAG: DNA-binding response regulator [Pseudozobellia sp.]|nr:DNA-binding response regulator [Pseudozobellia sp.]
MEKLRTVIVDASDNHRNKLSQLIEGHTALQHEGSFRNAIHAKKESIDQIADIVFLDIEMPLINAFDLIDTFQGKPEIILLCDKADYAAKAFDYHITDYLLKPVSYDRFRKAVNRAKENLKLRADAEEKAHFFIKSNLRKVKINYCDIKWIEALGDYIKLVTQKSNHVVLSSMKAFEKELPAEHFIRIHKSYIININRVQNLNHAVVEVEGHQMPISRKRRSELMLALGL